MDSSAKPISAGTVATPTGTAKALATTAAQGLPKQRGWTAA